MVIPARSKVADMKSKNQIDQKELRRQKILSEPILPLIVKMSVPTIVGMLIMVIYNLTDTFFVGLLNDKSMTAAIGVVFSFVSIIQAIGFWFGYGSGNIMSKKLGEQDEEEAIIISSIGIVFSIISGFLIAIISIGVGFMISLGLFRIFKEIELSTLMIIIYGVIFILMFIVNDLGHAIAFDASGATTGAMTTPFIIALGLGVSKLKGEKKGEENSFGLVGIASTGPILAGLLMTMSINSKNILLEEQAHQLALVSGFKSASFAILPITLVFFIMDKLVFKIKNKKSINLGLFYTYLGLIIFLASVEGGFMELARLMGENYSDFRFVPIIGFILGLLVVLAEPAVFVLAEQVEEVTGGSIHKSSIMKALSVGVAFAVMLAMFRIKIEGFKLWMIIVPGFLIALILSRNVSQLFVGIAFDSGGVASGPMTATFILGFCQGVAGNIDGGFGVIAFVALMPVITIMIMGSFYKEAIEG